MSYHSLLPSSIQLLDEDEEEGAEEGEEEGAEEGEEEENAKGEL